jgi:hypothetical protein
MRSLSSGGEDREMATTFGRDGCDKRYLTVARPWRSIKMKKCCFGNEARIYYSLAGTSDQINFCCRRHESLRLSAKFWTDPKSCNDLGASNDDEVSKENVTIEEFK